MNHTSLFSEIEKKQLVAAIKTAEERTIGEIKIHIENHCKDEVLSRAQQVFYNLKMNETKDRTGVLIYMACKDRKIAILGDSGINQKATPHFWDEIINTCLEEFKKEKYYEGLLYLLDKVAQILQHNFPANSASSGNEISNDISYGDDE